MDLAREIVPLVEPSRRALAETTLDAWNGDVDAFQALHALAHANPMDETTVGLCRRVAQASMIPTAMRQAGRVTGDGGTACIRSCGSATRNRWARCQGRPPIRMPCMPIGGRARATRWSPGCRISMRRSPDEGSGQRSRRKVSPRMMAKKRLFVTA